MRYPLEKEKFIQMYCEQNRRHEENDVEFAEALFNCLDTAYKRGFEDGVKKAGAKHE